MDLIPTIGTLMMPKTVAYIFIVYYGFKEYISEFRVENIFDSAVSFLIIGLGLGVFYREMTRIFEYFLVTHLGKLHPHMLIFGFVFSIILYLLLKNTASKGLREIQKAYLIYQVD